MNVFEPSLPFPWLSTDGKEIPSVTQLEFLTLVSRFGRNSNSFLPAYAGYRYFVPPRSPAVGVLAYVETRKALVGAAEPLSELADYRTVFREFIDFAKAKGKVAIILPVSESASELAMSLGFSRIKIGSEPLFELDRYVPNLDLIHTSKRLFARGARVRAFRPENLGSVRRAELDDMVEEWLANRKMASLGFLNRVEPWELEKHKKYFMVEYRGRVLSFLSAVPYPAAGGYYLVDVFRRASSPPGSTELLILESMRLLKEDGAREVSLGVAPLSDLSPQKGADYYRLSQVMNLAYSSGNLLYNFRSLYHFKLKFEPTRLSATYLLLHPKEGAVRAMMGMTEALVGTMSRALISGMMRRIDSLTKTGAVSSLLNNEIVHRPFLNGIGALMPRCPLTLLVLSSRFVDLLFVRGRLGRIDSGFSLHTVFSDTIGLFQAESLSLRLIVQLVVFISVAGLLEVIAGSLFVGVGILFGALAHAIYPLLPRVFYLFYSGLEGGGYFEPPGLLGCVGALTVMIKGGGTALVLFCATLLAYALATGNVSSLSLVLPSLLGAAGARLVLSYQNRL